MDGAEYPAGVVRPGLPGREVAIEYAAAGPAVRPSGQGVRVGLRAWRDPRRARWAVTAFVLLVYGIWIVGAFETGHDVRDFIHMGRRYVLEPHVKPLFALDADYPYAVTNNGYDGQFSYYIALDPVNARFHVDRVNYRYTRILYPMLVRALAAGRAPLMPYLLIAVNLLALAGGTFVLASLLLRRGLSPWIALIYGLSPGLFICLQRDLEEPLAYAFVVLGMYLYSVVTWRSTALRLLAAGTAFALAALTRESTALFPCILALGLLVQRTPVPGISGYIQRVMHTALFFGVSLAPFALYKIFLLHWLGPVSSPAPKALYPQLVPFAGLAASRIWTMLQVDVIVAVVVPAMLCAALGLWTLWRRQASVEVWLLLANVQLFVVMLNPLTYGNILGAARVATGVILAALLSIPAFDRVLARNRAWLWLSAAFWFAAWPALVPFGGRTPNVASLLVGFGSVIALWAVVERRTLTAWFAAAAARPARV